MTPRRDSNRAKWLAAAQGIISIAGCGKVLRWPDRCAQRGPNLHPGRSDMRRVVPAAVAAAIAAACSSASGPSGVPPRSTLHFVAQDTAYKLLSSQGSFYAKVGENRRLRLVYQGSTPSDSGPEFLRFEVPGDGLLRRPDGTAFAPGDSILPASRSSIATPTTTSTATARWTRRTPRSRPSSGSGAATRPTPCGSIPGR